LKAGKLASRLVELMVEMKVVMMVDGRAERLV
jgi:hypothetical protein